MSETIAVIGTINRDSIHLPNGKIRESYGGLLYSLIPLTQLLGSKLIIRPIVNVGQDCERAMLKYLKPFESLDLSKIHIVPEKNNHCHLFYHDLAGKTEILEGGVPPLEYRNLKAAFGSRLVIVNFISGNDLSLRSLERFRAEYKGPIYMDIHSLTLGKKKNGSRYLRKPLNWRRYCACADYLQMNEVEFALLSRTKPERDSLIDYFEHLHFARLKALLVTLGDKGAYLLYKKNRSTICCLYKASNPGKIVDTTGCGDVFGAAFSAALMLGFSLPQCVTIANRIAALKCRFSGIEKLNFKSLKRTR